MGALPLPKPRNLDQYGRDVDSPAERLRRRTNFAKGTGYSLLFHSMTADLPRLSRGASCTHLILAILAHQDRSKGGGGWSPALSLADWSSLAGCDEKEVQRNRDYLQSRKMADCRSDTKCKAGAKGAYSFRLRPETWQALEDYKVWIAKQPKDVVDVAEEAAEDAAADEKKAGTWRMSKPVKVKAGGTSRTFKPDVGVAGFRVKIENLDAGMFAVVQGGTLTVRIVGEVAQKAKSEGNKRVKTLTEDMDVLAPPAKGGNAGRVKHPRAGEILALFDPFLQKSGALLLAMHSQSLIKACDALGDTDHDFLVHFLMGPGGRGSAPIKHARFVPMICEDAKRAWERDKAGLGRPAREGRTERAIREARALVRGKA